MPIARHELLEHVVRLGREFRRRGMTEHARKLRLYWLALRHRLEERGGTVDLHWSADHVEEWERILGLAGEPFVVQAKGAGCPKCGHAHASSVHTERSWSGGWLHRCAVCDTRWVVLEDRR